MGTNNKLLLRNIGIASVMVIVVIAVLSQTDVPETNDDVNSAEFDSDTLELRFEKEFIEISLNSPTQILTTDESILISLENVALAHRFFPSSVHDLPIYGTSVPDLIRTGTYLTENGTKEFWYTSSGTETDIVTIELKNHEFDVIVLESEKSDEWRDKINELISYEDGWGDMLDNSMNDNDKSVIVMVAPSITEEYYEEVFLEIIEYDINAVNTIYGKDNVVLLVDDATKHLFEGQIPDDAIHVSDVADIWIRDFGTVDTLTEVKFDYKPQYLADDDSIWIDDSYRDWFDTKNLSSKKSDLILDGGNLVFNGDSKAITTVRIFEDNPQYSESEIDSMLKELLQVTEIAYLPEEEGDITGHSDGMVMWAESDKLLVNEYQEPFRSQVLSELEKSFSDIEIVEIPYMLQKDLWRDWPSACGYYLNSLVTENYIYVPVYGLEKDQMVLDLIQSHTSKKVVSIDASNVCFMGGSVRCLTWTTDGLNAEKILEN